MEWDQLQYWNENSIPEFKEFLAAEEKYLQQAIPLGSSVLEVGCGYGRILHVLEEGRIVTGIDNDPHMVQLAKERTACTVMHANASDLPFDAESFDYSLCVGQTFGNMRDIETKVIQEMQRVVKRIGKVIVSVYPEYAREVQLRNYAAIHYPIIGEEGNAVLGANGFYSRRFARCELEALFAGAGLSCAIEQLSPDNYLVTGTKR